MISHAASTTTAIGSAQRAGFPPNSFHFRHSSQAKKYMISPCVKWLGEYQSVTCWLLPFDCTTPCHSLTSPQVQIGGRSIANSTATASATSTSVTIQALRCGLSLLSPTRRLVAAAAAIDKRDSNRGRKIGRAHV